MHLILPSFSANDKKLKEEKHILLLNDRLVLLNKQQIFQGANGGSVFLTGKKTKNPFMAVADLKHAIINNIDENGTFDNVKIIFYS